MEIKVTENSEIITISLEGEIDMQVTNELREALLENIDKNSKRIIVDFQNVDFIDSSGLAVLIEGLKISKNKDSGFELCDMKEQVKDVFNLAQLDKVFIIK